MELVGIDNEDNAYIYRLMTATSSRYNLILIETMENIFLQMQIEVLETFIHSTGNWLSYMTICCSSFWMILYKYNLHKLEILSMYAAMRNFGQHSTLILVYLSRCWSLLIQRQKLGSGKCIVCTQHCPLPWHTMLGWNGQIWKFCSLPNGHYIWPCCQFLFLITMLIGLMKVSPSVAVNLLPCDHEVMGSSSGNSLL
jgi:hypothetical protein